MLVSLSLSLSEVGCSWSCLSTPGAPSTYNCTFPAMIDDWRGKWKNASEHMSSTFPFGFVQVYTCLPLSLTPVSAPTAGSLWL